MWCKHTTSVSCVFCLDAQLYTSIQKEQLEDNLRYFLHEHKIMPVYYGSSKPEI